MSTTFLPNKNIGEPAVGDAGWGVTTNTSWGQVDSAFGGNQTFNLASASGVVSVSATSWAGNYPANTASYIPNSWTLTGTLTANVILQIPSGVGGKWVINNQCSMGGFFIEVTASGGSTNALLFPGSQIVYSDGLGNINQASNISQYAFRNRIINGDFRVWQRGTSFTLNSVGYTADRFLIGFSGSTVTVNQISNPYVGLLYGLQITGTGGNTTTTVNQRIEMQNCADLANQTVTFSAVVYASSPQTVKVTYFSANSADNFSGITQQGTTTWSVTSTPTRFSWTLTLANIQNGFQFQLSPNNGAGFTSGTFTTAGWQLEQGPTATSFEIIPYPTQFVCCQRYYESVPTWGSFTNTTTGALVWQYFEYKVQKRTTPTLTSNSFAGTNATFSSLSSVSSPVSGFAEIVNLTGSFAFFADSVTASAEL